jgi:Peptidase family S41
VGFIRVTQFNEQTTEGLKKAIANLTTQAGDKLKGFVVDLRNNPGGLLDQAISVSDAFLEKGGIARLRCELSRRACRHFLSGFSVGIFVESAVVSRPDGAVRLPAHTGPIGFSPTNQIHG